MISVIIFKKMGNICCSDNTTKENSKNEWTIYYRLQTQLDSGCKYEGEWREGKPNGKGVARWPDGWTFEGSFIEGIPHGG